MVPWYNGSMVQWFHGTMVQWFHGTMVQWFHGSMVERFYGTIVPWYNSSIVEWFHGTLYYAFSNLPVDFLRMDQWYLSDSIPETAELCLWSQRFNGGTMGDFNAGGKRSSFHFRETRSEVRQASLELGSACSTISPMGLCATPVRYEKVRLEALQTAKAKRSDVSCVDLVSNYKLTPLSSQSHL
jgi:hypothetical protein